MHETYHKTGFFPFFSCLSLFKGRQSKKSHLRASRSLNLCFRGNGTCLLVLHSRESNPLVWVLSDIPLSECQWIACIIPPSPKGKISQRAALLLFAVHGVCLSKRGPGGGGVGACLQIQLGSSLPSLVARLRTRSQRRSRRGWGVFEHINGRCHIRMYVCMYVCVCMCIYRSHSAVPII